MNSSSPETLSQISPHKEPRADLSQAIYQTTYPSPLGPISLAAGNDALIGLWLNEQKHFTKTLHDQLIVHAENPILTQTRLWLDSYFRQENPNPHAIPLQPAGTTFQLIVWQILAQIPYGQVTTYGEIARQVAKRLGKPKMSAQAVGGAVGRNPISIIVPCHRVIGAAGKLTGYAGGLDKKQFLLRLEGIDLKQFY